MRGAFCYGNLVPSPQKVSVPTLVTVGRHDRITPVVCSELIAEKVPNSL